MTILQQAAALAKPTTAPRDGDPTQAAWYREYVCEREEQWIAQGPDALAFRLPETIQCIYCRAPLPELERAPREAHSAVVALWEEHKAGCAHDDGHHWIEHAYRLDGDIRPDVDLEKCASAIFEARYATCPRCLDLVEKVGSALIIFEPIERGKTEPFLTDDGKIFHVKEGVARTLSYTEEGQKAQDELDRIVACAMRWGGRAPVNFLEPWTAPSFEATDVPDALARYPVLYSEQTGIDPSISLTAAVGVAAAAIDDRIQICGDRASDWFESARLWTVGIALPSAGKTPTLRRMSKPLEQIEKELLNTYQAQLDIWEGADPETRGAKPGRPCVITTNPTIEAQANILVANERGILLKAEEFGTWMGSMDRHNKDGGDRAYQLSAFDGGPLSIERATEGKSRYVQNWGASLLAGTTPAEIERLSRKLGHMDGLLARIIPVLACSRVYVEDAQKPPEERVRKEREDYHALIRKLWYLKLPVEGVAVGLSREAQEAFAAWRKELLRLIEGYENREPALAAHLGKYEAMLLRITLTFHAIECVAANAHPVDNEVSADTFARAIRYMRRVGQHATVFHLNASSSEAVQLAKDIGLYVLASKSDALVLERRELVQNVRRFKSTDDRRLREAALGLLVDYAWLLPCEEGEGYKKELPTRWDINPVLADTMAAEVARERERRELVSGHMAEAFNERKRQKRGDKDGDS